ncbi:MAG: hypothetical protein GQ475_01065, partial [Methylococcaceae bacterium]|nr:hypothetical protein [Methylococcaceae bacterium]
TATPTSGSLVVDVNGDNAITVTATDVSGNTSAAATQTLVIDTIAPSVIISTETLNTYLTVQLEAIDKLNGSDYEPRITAVGSTGEYVVTWHGEDSAGDFSIFVQKFNADGSITNNAPVQLEAIGKNNGFDGGPQITAVGSTGEYVVTWHGEDSAGDFSIFVQKFNADGTIGGNAPVQLEAIDKLGETDSSPQITAVGSMGEYVVTWQGSENDNSIFVQKFNADGTITGNTPVQLEAIEIAAWLDERPQVTAVGSTGEYVVTWQGQDSEGDVSIFVQKFNANGTITNNAPVQLEAIEYADGEDLYPQVAAVGSAGEYVVTWQGMDSDFDESIFVQKFTVNGTIGSNAPVQLEAIGNSGGFDHQPQVTAVGNNGDFVVTWYGFDTNSEDSVFVQKFDADGTVTDNVPVQLDVVENVVGGNYDPQITAVGSDGEYMVTWAGVDSEGDLSIFVQKFNANGTITDNTPVQLEAIGNATANDTLPQITAVGSAGEFVVSWSGYDSDSGADPSIFVQKFSASGEMVNPIKFTTSDVISVQSSDVGTAYLVSSSVTVNSLADITTAAGNLWNSVVIATADQDVSIAATGLASGTYYVYSADAAGNLSTQASDVVTLVPSISSVSIDDGNYKVGDDALVTVTAVDDVTGLTLSGHFNGQGLTNISDNNDGTYTGTYTVVEGDTDVADLADVNTHLILANSDGITSSPTTTVTLSGESIDTTAPSVIISTETLKTYLTVQLDAIDREDGNDLVPQVTAVGSAGEYVVTWQGSDSEGDDSIFVQKFNADSTIGSNSLVQLEAIGKVLGHDASPQITGVGSAGEYVVTWHGVDSEDDYSIFVQKFNADGTIGSNTPVQLEAIEKLEGADISPQITAVGSTGEYVVTWQGIDSENDSSIFVQKFNDDGTITNNVAVKLEAIGNTARNDQQPQITSVGSDGEYVVTWSGRDSDSAYSDDYSIFVQKFNADGTVGSNVPVQLEATGNAAKTDEHPQVTSVGSEGEYVVVWFGEDSDSGNDYSIFVQKFDANGTIGSNAPVQLEAIGYAGGDDRYPQVTAVGSTGEYVVAWSGGDSDFDDSIFVQKFNSNGTITDNAPVQLEAIELSYGNDSDVQITAVGNLGEYVVTWFGNDSDSLNDFSIFVQKFNADGTTDGHTPVQLEAIGNLTGIDEDPQITAVGSAGEFVVSWSGRDSGADFSIFVQKFSAEGTLIDPVKFTTSDMISVQSSEVGTAYLVSSNVTVNSLADITTAANNLWNSVVISTADQDVSIAATGLENGTYYVYSADAAGNLSTQASDVVTLVPEISSVSIDDGNYKVGDDALVTVTAVDDVTGLTLSGSFNGQDLTNITDNNDGTYTGTYTVVEGNAVVADLADVNTHLILANSDGIESSATTIVTLSGENIDARAPDLINPILGGGEPFSINDGSFSVSKFLGLTLSFDESIMIGTGNIWLVDGFDSSRNQTVDVESNAGQLTISGSELTITLATALTGSNYHLEIDDGAITDLSGNNYAGIDDSTTFNFVTEGSASSF